MAPRYWQSPAILKHIYVSTSGGAAAGTESTNAVAGTVAVQGASSSLTSSSIAADQARETPTANGSAADSVGGLPRPVALGPPGVRARRAEVAGAAAGT